MIPHHDRNQREIAQRHLQERQLDLGLTRTCSSSPCTVVSPARASSACRNSRSMGTSPRGVRYAVAPGAMNDPSRLPQIGRCNGPSSTTRLKPLPRPARTPAPRSAPSRHSQRAARPAPGADRAVPPAPPAPRTPPPRGAAPLHPRIPPPRNRRRPHTISHHGTSAAPARSRPPLQPSTFRASTALRPPPRVPQHHQHRQHHHRTGHHHRSRGDLATAVSTSRARPPAPRTTTAPHSAAPAEIPGGSPPPVHPGVHGC